MARPRTSEEERVTTAIRLPRSLHQRLHRAASERDVSANLLATRALSDYLDRLPDPERVLATDPPAGADFEGTVPARAADPGRVRSRGTR